MDAEADSFEVEQMRIVLWIRVLSDVSIQYEDFLCCE